MTPTELKSANIKRFEDLIKEQPDQARLAVLQRLLREETDKPLSAYPEEARPQGPDPEVGRPHPDRP